MKKSKLDSLLHDWAARHTGDPARRETLVEGIRQQVACQSAPATHDPPPATRPQWLRGRLVYALCGFAAGLLVAVGWFVVSRWWREPILADPGVEIALLSPSEIKRSGELFRRMEEIFPGDLRWVAESNGEVSLGLGQVPREGVSRAAPILVRTVVLERKRGESSWNRILTADVLSRSEELVEVSPGRKPAGRLLVWAYRLPDGNVAVDASLRLMESLRTSVDSTSVLSPGKAAQVATVQTADGEFRVFQAASPMSS
jgi:hypothetical protein